MVAGNLCVETQLSAEGWQGRRVRAKQTELDQLRLSRIRAQILQMAVMDLHKWSHFYDCGIMFNDFYPLYTIF